MPGGPGGREVGRISLRVVPDLTGFRERVRDAVRGIPDPEIAVDADTGKAEAKIEEVSKDRKAEVKVEADTGRAEAQIDRVARDRTSKVKVDVDKVGLNPEVVTRFLNDVQSRLNRGVQGLNQVTLRPEIVSGRFMEQLRARQFEQLEQQIKLKPHLDPVGIEEMRLRLAHENFTAKVKLETDKANLDRMVRNVESEFGHKLDKIFTAPLRGGGGGGGGGGGFGGAGAGGMGKMAMMGDQTFWVAGAVLAFLAPALALLATSLASLPALIAAVALPIGAIVLGVGGFKKALENVGLAGEDKKGKLKPGEELKKLQEDVSSEFERGLTPVFRELVGLLPTLREGFVGIARGVVADIQGLSDAFTKGDGPAQIKNLMGNVGEMLNQMAPGLHSFASAILGLASKVSDHLPGLAKFFDEWGGKFDAWVKKISGDGTLDKAISGLKPVLDEVMNFFATMMDSGLKLMGDPAMAANIATVLRGITNFINESLPALNQVFGSIAAIMRGLGLDHPSKDLQPGKPGAPGQPAQPGGPMSPMPAAPWSGGKFSWVQPEPKVKIPYERQGFLDQLETDTWRRLKETFSPGAMGKNPLGSGPEFAMRGLNKVNGWMGQNVGQPVGDFMNQNIGGPVGRFFTGNNQWQHNASNMFKGALDEAKRLPGEISAALSQVENIANETWNKVSAAAGEQWNKIVNTCKDALNKLPGELEGIGKSIMEGLKRGIESGVHLVEGAIRNLAGLIPQWAKDMLGIKSPSTVMYDVGASTVEGLQNGLDSGAQGVIDRARAIAQSVQGAMQGGFTPGSRSGAAGAAIEQAESMVGQSYVSGISDCSGAISQVYSAMTGKKTHFTTMADFAALGFKQGFKPGALNIGVTPLPGQSGHMAATLPDGRNFESGGRLGGGPKVGGGAAGAQDGQFSQHWYYDAGGGALAGGADVAGMQGEIKQSLMELDVERDKLQAQRDALPKGKESKDQRDAISEQLKQIKMARDALVTQRDELKLGASHVGAGALGGKGGDSMSEAASMITKALASVIDMAKGAVMAPLGELEHDLGIGGNGAIPKIAEFGLGWAQGELTNMVGAQFGQGKTGKFSQSKDGDVHFHVNSMDEALQADQTRKNRQALQWKDR